MFISYCCPRRRKMQMLAFALAKSLAIEPTYAIITAVACSNLALLNPSKASNRARYAIYAPL